MLNADGPISYKNVFDSQHNGVIVVDKDGYITMLNEAAEEILGFKEQYAVGKYIKDLVPNSGMIKVIQNAKAHLARKFKVGEKVYMVNRSLIYTNGKMVGAVATLQEITELESIIQEMESVKELKGTLETILESAYDGVIVINKEGIITMLNGAYASNLGINAQDAIGKHVGKVLGENTSLLTVLRSGHAKLGEIIWLNEHEVIANSIPIKKSGHIIGAVGKIMFKGLRELDSLSQKVYSLRRELRYYRDSIEQVRGAHFMLKDIISESQEITLVKEEARCLLNGTTAVLIRGESGVGKESFAHALHLESHRQFGPFIKINCGHGPEKLLDAEMFGYTDGAFSGAKKGGQVGKLQLASKGTVFLDEVDALPLNLQAKLLKVLQDKKVQPLGDGKAVVVDIRIIASSNRLLEDLIAKGLFNQEFFQKLAVNILNIPPLRNRKADILPLAKHFIFKFNHQFNTEVKDLSPEVSNLFMQYNWPGNVREMKNVLERSFNMVEGNTIYMQYLPAYLQQGAHRFSKGRGLAAIMAETERTAIIEALAISKGNKSRAASHLGISRAWLYERMEKHGISDIQKIGG